ncbi:snoRNA-binding protein [Xenoophorus captivus]|uniref:SnoRNA-binding protein n=1 Tax=Xenoophorus captivus TaxID=1517983 RepID=A0ABV0RQN5_9TELE
MEPAVNPKGRCPTIRFKSIHSWVLPKDNDPKHSSSIVVLAGDTLPIDVYCHLPVMCEDRNLPYAYIPSKVDLGSSAGSKRPTCVILIKPHEDYQDAYNECLDEVSNLPKPL